MSEKEWREASDLRSSTLGIGLVVVSAATLRFWSLGHGIPFAVGVDEPEIIGRVVRMMNTGDFNPHFFDYPGLYFYVQLAVACLRFLVGAMTGLWRSLDQVGPADFYLWARACTALFGIATVWVVYQIGMRWGARHALLAAGLMAVAPNHVRESHYVLTDVPMTFFVALTFWLSLRAHERGTLGAFAWAGAAAGLAAATKYNGIVALLLPLLAAYLTAGQGSSRLGRALAVVGASIVAFLVSAPYTILDLPGFLNGFARLAGSYAPARAAAEPGWMIYLKHLRLALAWPGLVLVFAGLGLGLVRTVTGPGHARFALLVAFPLTYFFLIATQALIFGRYLLPLIPFVSLLAAIAVISGVSLLRRFAIPRPIRTALIAGLTVAAVLPPALSAVGFNRRISKTSTQAMAYEWIVRHLPPGSRIAVEPGSPSLPPERYRADLVRQLIERDHAGYVADGYEYLIASSQAYGRFFAAPEAHAAQYAAYRGLFDQSTELWKISESDDHPGPEFRVFRLRR